LAEITFRNFPGTFWYFAAYTAFEKAIVGHRPQTCHQPCEGRVERRPKQSAIGCGPNRAELIHRLMREPIRRQHRGNESSDTGGLTATRGQQKVV
jgi:hypothetical protein